MQLPKPVENSKSYYEKNIDLHRSTIQIDRPNTANADRLHGAALADIDIFRTNTMNCLSILLSERLLFTDSIYNRIYGLYNTVKNADNYFISFNSYQIAKDLAYYIDLYRKILFRSNNNGGLQLLLLEIDVCDSLELLSQKYVKFEETR